MTFRRTSDDPLLSNSAQQQEHDHNDNELLRQEPTSTIEPSQLTTYRNGSSRRKLATTANNAVNIQMPKQQQLVEQPAIKTPKQPTKTRRKGPIKLRFHHQALPQEYLNHYESQQNAMAVREQQQLEAERLKLLNGPKKKSQTKAIVSMPPPPVAIKKPVPTTNDEKLSNENILSWLQNILELQNTDESKVPKAKVLPLLTPLPTTSKMQCLKDLPYMGEMTLENTKPRRGRKPKKADICHLIYKNYGTIVPGSNASMTMTTTTTATTNASAATKKNLELPRKKASPLAVKKVKHLKNSSTASPPVPPARTSQNEPLNLCMRETKPILGGDSSILISDDNEDSNDLIMRGHVRDYVDCCEADSIDLEFSSTIPSLISPLDLSGDLSVSTPSKSELLSTSSTASPPLSIATSTGTTTTNPPAGYIYWPSAGLFIHPMALYYQKMVEEQMPSIGDSSTSSSTSSISSAMNSETNTLWDQSIAVGGLESPTINLKNPDYDMENLTQLIKTENLLQSPPPVLSELLKDTRTLMQSPAIPSTSAIIQTQKRKRSAIFIPPVQNESSTNPTNEVSICKFKFTGGAKPSLQEKKILSVDAGGNFRYYSGTGDKSMRGYEFFPRESLQKSSLSSGSHTNAFLNAAASEKIPLDMMPSLDLNNKLLHLTSNDHGKEIDVATVLENSFPNEEETDLNLRFNKGDDRSSRRKKSTSRSLQRAKLEKTFKEKGFLIQTQQLQSAEGATYCKFRQLRKFTRYLFR